MLTTVCSYTIIPQKQQEGTSKEQMGTAKGIGGQRTQRTQQIGQRELDQQIYCVATGARGEPVTSRKMLMATTTELLHALRSRRIATSALHQRQRPQTM